MVEMNRMTVAQMTNKVKSWFVTWSQAAKRVRLVFVRDVQNRQRSWFFFHEAREGRTLSEGALGRA
jgi:hypothetical protein